MKKLAAVFVVFAALVVLGREALLSAEPAEKPTAGTIKQLVGVPTGASHGEHLPKTVPAARWITGQRF